MNRRSLLKAAGFTAASLIARYPMLAAHRPRSVSEDEILGNADTRIEENRKGDIALRLASPAGKPLVPGTEVAIRQTGHEFLFGCNIFRLNRCRTTSDNDAYAERFADLLNFATLPFYWWRYERQHGKPDHSRTEEILAWCLSNDMEAKGHPLAWNYRDPSWLTPHPADIKLSATLPVTGRDGCSPKACVILLSR